MSTARMQITLDRGTQLKVRRKAERIGVPVAEYVRRVIAADLGGEPPKADIRELFGIASSASPTNIAKDKKAMIADAIAGSKTTS